MALKFALDDGDGGGFVQLLLLWEIIITIIGPVIKIVYLYYVVINGKMM